MCSRFILLITVLYVFSSSAFAQLRLPALVSDGMVLQRDHQLNIWGWAAPGDRVSVKFGGKQFKARAAAEGAWQVQLPSMKAGGPFIMEISAGKEKITIKDILIGDVWLCSGQSNMEHQMSLHATRYAAEIARSTNPAIRQFLVRRATDLQGPGKDLKGSWTSANPTNVLRFSAVAYFFAAALYDKLQVPIGLINSSVGGSPIEAWLSEEALREFPDIFKTVERNKDTSYINALLRKAQAREEESRKKEPADKGLTSSTPWYSPAYKPRRWRTITVPGYWEDQGIRDLDGVVWYRKEIEVPASMTGIPATVFLGRIVDADVLYINGAQAGNTTYQYPQRKYAIPAGVLRPGKNLLVVRVTNDRGKGGFVPDKPYYITAGGESVDLKGDWQYKVGEVYEEPPKGGGIILQYQPMALYNAMIAPMEKYAIRGIVWYQGESNASRGSAALYNRLLPALITDWRTRWRQGNLPFLYVQLPNFMDVNYKPSESHWAELREAQLKTLSVPQTGMAVTIDLGEWNDVHPDNKKDVGERLALAARKTAYGEELVYSGPLYQSAEVKGDKIIIHFSSTGTGLTTIDGEAPGSVAIAGADKRFVWANAKIEGNTLVVWSPKIPAPLYVRYAWADNPENPNLYNREGLPASPFRTD